MTRKSAAEPKPTSWVSAARDVERLQGAWTVLAGRKQVELLFEGERFVARFRAGEVYEGTFRLDAKKRPRQIDMTVVAGPSKHRGRTFLGIYELIGETMLRWCPGRPDLKHRLHGFPEPEDEAFLTLVLKRPTPEWVGEAW